MMAVTGYDDPRASITGYDPRVSATGYEDPCRRCAFDEEGGCSCPPSEKWYSCPARCRKPENVRSLEEYADWVRQKGKEVGLWD